MKELQNKARQSLKGETHNIYRTHFKFDLQESYQKRKRVLFYEAKMKTYIKQPTDITDEEG